MDISKYYKMFLNGDNNGLAQIISTFKDGLILYLNTYVRNIAVAEELTEETFVKLVLKKPRFSGDASFKTWLYSIGRNIALDYLRKSKKREISLDSYPEILDDEKNLEQNYIQFESRILVHRAMRKLKAEYQQVLWLIYFEKFTCKETARILGKTPHNVETMAYRARNALKIKLIEEGYIYEEL